MSDDAADISAGLDRIEATLTESVRPSEPTPAAEPARPTVAETLARVHGEIQQREGNAPGQRGPDGKFQPRQAPVAAAPGTPIPDQPSTEGNEPPPAAIEAPQSWSAEMKAQWSALPPDVQATIAKRESEAHAKISDQGSKLKSFDSLAQVIEPNRAELMAAYGSVEKGVNDLLTLRSLAVNNPREFVVQFARGAGIDIAQLAQQAAQGHFQPRPVDPHIAALHQEVAALKGTLTTQALGESQKIVDAFKAKPENKHYAAVESRIAELLHSGAATDLPTAYEMATWADPKIRSTLIAEQAAADKAKADAEAKRLADEARRANVVNIRTPGARASGTPTGSIRDSLVRAYDRVNGAA